jgi:DNA-binding transcriptional ArsR family regulator
MGATKKNVFSAEEEKISGYLKALGHPARIAILNLLIKKQSCICGDIVDEIALAQSTISQHLKELKEVNLIKGDIDGTSVCYCINEVEWKKAQNMIQAFLASAAFTNGKCC